MSDENEYRNPKRINDDVLIFAWPATKVMPCLMMMGASMLMGHFLFFVVLSICWWVAYGYLSERFAPGIIVHFLYWHGFTTGITKESTTIPDAMKREFFS